MYPNHHQSEDSGTQDPRDALAAAPLPIEAGGTSATRSERRSLMAEQFTALILLGLRVVANAVRSVHQGCTQVFPNLSAAELARRNYSEQQMVVYRARATGDDNGGGITGTVSTPDLIALFAYHPKGTHEYNQIV
jgi:hypothetical protein